MAARKGWLIVVLLVFVGLGAGLLALGALFSEKRVEVKSGSTLVIDLSGSIAEDPPIDSRSQLFYKESPTLWDYLRALDHAARDPRIAMILLKINHSETGWAKIEELRAKLAEVETHGKKVVAFIEAGEDKDYALATAARPVDSLLSPDQLEGLLPGGHEGPRVTLKQDLASRPREEGPFTAPRIAVIHATGTIVHGKSGTDPVWGRTIGSDSFVNALEAAEDLDDVKAIVVRIDSP